MNKNMGIMNKNMGIMNKNMGIMNKNMEIMNENMEIMNKRRIEKICFSSNYYLSTILTRLNILPNIFSISQTKFNF